MSHINDIVSQVNRYYTDTAWDYKYLWISKALAVHFGYYDDTITNHNTSLLKMNAILADKIDVRKGEKVIDAGCGVGGSSIWLTTNKQCEVTGINIVDQQLAEAAINAERAGVLDKVKFVKADYSDLPFESTFDVFWALESIVHAYDKEKVISEAYRVLNTKGRIVVAEYMLREKPPLNKKEQEFLFPWLDGWSMPSLLTSSEYEKILSSVGFTNIQKININRNVHPSLQRLKWLCRLFLPGAMTMESLGFLLKRG